MIPAPPPPPLSAAAAAVAALHELASAAADVQDWDDAAAPLPPPLPLQDCTGLREASLATMPLELGQRQRNLRPQPACPSDGINAAIDSAYAAACIAVPEWATAATQPTAAVFASMKTWLRKNGHWNDDMAAKVLAPNFRGMVNMRLRRARAALQAA